jgi:hypothetical protein
MKVWLAYQDIHRIENKYHHGLLQKNGWKSLAHKFRQDKEQESGYCLIGNSSIQAAVPLEISDVVNLI